MVFNKKRFYVPLIVAVSFTAVSVNAAQTDPTRPLSGSTAAISANKQVKSLELQSIIRANTSNERTAIISGNLVSVGTQLSKYRVTKITDNQVELNSSEGKKVLTLLSSSIVSQK